MRVATVVFPGTNCDQDMLSSASILFGDAGTRIWHEENELPPETELAVLPGGFSYGDYLRAGALAQTSRVMPALKNFVENGGKLLGICNGFQILCEAGLLPGVLLPNAEHRFLSRPVFIRCEDSAQRIFSNLEVDSLVQCPIAHGDGRYFIAESELEELRREKQVVLRYCRPDGAFEYSSPEEAKEWNPNGSVDSIAGVCDKTGRVLGFMPHPERIVEELILPQYKSDGVKLLKSLAS